MKQAIWNGEVIAESDQTILIEGNHYFHPDSVRQEYLQKSDHRSTCPWKGNASYFDVVVDGEVNADAAWTYMEPQEAAKRIKGYISFWGGVKVTD